MPKKYITVQLEVDYWVEEDYDETEFKYPEVIESVLPVSIEAHTMSSQELRAVNDYLRHADDADYDLMWDLRGLLSDRAEELTDPA
jgi:hypothetical protein